MASKKAQAIKLAKEKAKQEARWKRMELLILAIAQELGIDPEAVLATVEGRDYTPEPKAEFPKAKEESSDVEEDDADEVEE